MQSATEEIVRSIDEQLGRWVQHFSLLYFKHNVVTDDIQHIESLPTMDDLDNEPTVEELNKAITAMAPWKTPGSDDILSDLLQHCKSCLLPLLYDILVKCLKEGMVTQDMCDSKIINLYKIMGTRSDCNNHRGISILELLLKLLHM